MLSEQRRHDVTLRLAVELLLRCSCCKASLRAQSTVHIVVTPPCSLRHRKHFNVAEMHRLNLATYDNRENVNASSAALFFQHKFSYNITTHAIPTSLPLLDSRHPRIFLPAPIYEATTIALVDASMTCAKRYTAARVAPGAIHYSRATLCPVPGPPPSPLLSPTHPT